MGVPCFGLLIIGILLFRVYYIGVPYFRKLPYPVTLNRTQTTNPNPYNLALLVWDFGGFRTFLNPKP